MKLVNCLKKNVSEGEFGIKRVICAYIRPRNLIDFPKRAQLHQKLDHKMSTYDVGSELPDYQSLASLLYIVQTKQLEIVTKHHNIIPTPYEYVAQYLVTDMVQW